MPSINISTTKKFANKKFEMRAYCASFNDATVTVTISEKLRKKLGLKSRTIGTGTGNCDGNNRLVAKIKPTAEAADALSGYKKAVNATATLTTTGISPVLTATRSFKLAKKGKS